MSQFKLVFCLQSRSLACLFQALFTVIGSSLLSVNLCHAAPLAAGFETVINSPPTTFERFGQINSNTQLNLYPGGILPRSYSIGPIWTPGNNIEVNLLGGSIGSRGESFHTFYSGSKWTRTTNVTLNLMEGRVWGGIAAVNGTLVRLNNAAIDGDLELIEGSLAIMSGGEVRQDVSVDRGSMLLMSDGHVDGSLRVTDSLARITGGRIEGSISVYNDGRLEISGGTSGHFLATRNTTIVGGEFKLNGIPISAENGSSQSISFPAHSVLTGTLADGTPAIIANQVRFAARNRFWDEKITLRHSEVPAATTQGTLTAGTTPNGLRPGQSLTLLSGTSAPNNFAALEGTTVTIAGGEMGHGFEAIETQITLSSGRIGGLATLYHGSTLEVTGGQVGSNFELASGSRLELRGGRLGLLAYAHSGSEVYYAGGIIDDYFTAETGSSFTIAGGEFHLDGIPIPELGTASSTKQFDIPAGSVLSGTLSNGRVIAIHSDNHAIAPGTLTLESTTLPASGGPVFHVPNDPAPRGLRPGQTLLLSAGGEIGDAFTTSSGSVVRMDGGTIGRSFKSMGSFVSMSGGEIGDLELFHGSLANLDGGSVDWGVSVHNGALLNLNGGDIRHVLSVRSGGVARVSGGTIQGQRVYVNSGGSLTATGGTIHSSIIVADAKMVLHGGLFLDRIDGRKGSKIVLHGGQLGDGFRTYEESQVLIHGHDLRIDGILVSELLPREPRQIYLPTGAVLSGVYANGTPFAFTSSDGDHFHSGTLSIGVPVTFSSRGTHYYPYPWPIVSRKGILPNESLTLNAEDTIHENFTAGWGSHLVVDGGSIGENFEAVGADVHLINGHIGDNMDVMLGTEFNVLGGSVGKGLQIHRGGVANISGGDLESVSVDPGGAIHISGGNHKSHRITLSPNSDLILYGTDFTIDGQSMELLALGDSIVLEFDGETLFGDLIVRAMLLDGSSYAAYIDFDKQPMGTELQQSHFATITLTNVLPSASSQVPEPTGILMVLAFSTFLAGRRTYFLRHLFTAE